MLENPKLTTWGEWGGCVGKPSIPVDGANAGSPRGCPAPLTPSLEQAGREAELTFPAAPAPGSARRLRFVRHDSISASPPREAPRGRLCMRGTQTDSQQPGSARQSRPLSACHPRRNGERGAGGSAGTGAAPRPSGGDRDEHPRGGFGRVSVFFRFW